MQHVPQSPYPVYDEPLQTNGNALVIPDPEVPFHHADFLNRCLDLADAWGIKQAIIAGDGMHYASLSSWGADWVKETKDGLSPEALDRLQTLASTMRGKARRDLEATLQEIGEREEPTSGVAAEVFQTRKVFKNLGECFDQIDYVIGNHDDRFLRALDSPLFAGDLLKFLALPEPKWRIAPFYYSILKSGGETFRIEHPKSASQCTPEKLASKYLCHILAAHSHYWSMRRDQSGKFWAISMGCCVDERRLPYASQRSTNAPAHSLGACIVRDGFPWLLSDVSPWWDLRKQ